MRYLTTTELIILSTYTTLIRKISLTLQILIYLLPGLSLKQICISLSKIWGYWGRECLAGPNFDKFFSQVDTEAKKCGCQLPCCNYSVLSVGLKAIDSITWCTFGSPYISKCAHVANYQASISYSRVGRPYGSADIKTISSNLSHFLQGSCFFWLLSVPPCFYSWWQIRLLFLRNSLLAARNVQTPHQFL